MPERIVQQYHFGGWAEVLIYSEQEMADALGIGRKQLRDALEGRARLGLRYHAHPSSGALNEYQFTQEVYDYNKQVFTCAITAGHKFDLDHFYDELKSLAVYKCRNCPAERID